MNSSPSEVAFYRLNREDAKIHRCDCGSWVYADNPCGACDPAIVHRLRVVDPQVVDHAQRWHKPVRDRSRIRGSKVQPRTGEGPRLRPLTRVYRGATS